MFDEWLERRQQQRKISLILGVVLLFLVSLVMSCQEMRYMASGKSTDAALMSDVIERSKNRRGDIMEQRVVRYSFVDGERTRQEYARVANDWALRPGAQERTVRVQYIAGRDLQSRLEGQHHTVWVVVFGVSVALMVLGFWWISRPG